jgi:Ca2+-binding RTX toxin-like protein
MLLTLGEFMLIASHRMVPRSYLKISLVVIATVALGLGAAPAYGAVGPSAPKGLPQAGSQHTCFGEPATIVGAPGQQTVGTEGDDVIYADGGHVLGLAGDDLICGYAYGADGGAGDDRIKAFYQFDARYHGGPGNDTLYGPGKFDQSAFVYLFGDAGRDRLLGGAAGERLNGGSGADVLRGGPALDVLKGKAGDDRLDGGKGNDRMNGGEGRDRCVDGTLNACETGDAA